MEDLPFKISVLVFVGDTQGRQLLIRRKKQPNKDCWSPIGGKLEMGRGESPFETAIRETYEEISLKINESDLRLFSIISEKGYEGSGHWLMFLFECSKKIERLPEEIDEGSFKFFRPEEIETLKIPDTDRQMLWEIWRKHRDDGQVILRADCTNPDKISWKTEQIIK